jgi:tetrapyrrole methylase family protein / MazG family protein
VVEQFEEEFTTLVKVIARLRGSDGCPWDRKQTHSSLREFLLQENYEVLEALDESDYPKLCQELGDLLLQIILHAQIASENGEFTLKDVLKNINTKLVRRHPHVFGNEKVQDAAEVSHNWETLKKKERKEDSSLLDSVPRQMPALAYSQEIQRRVAQIGFDWDNIDGVMDKLVEEVKELNQSVSLKEKADEFGDIFFTLANISRRLGIDPEASLRQANRKFYRRFKYMEELSRERGLDFSKLSFVEQNSLWEEAKLKVEN